MHVDPPSTICDLKPGDHAGCVHETDAERDAAATACVREGLGRGEKVLYLADRDAIAIALQRLSVDGVDPALYLRREQLRCLIQGGDADAGEAMARTDWLTSRIASETASAEAQGYPALWLIQDMTWVMRRMSNGGRLVEYERRLGEWLPGARCVAICHYDSRRCDHELVMQVMLHLHSITMFGTDLRENRQYSAPPLDEPLTRWIETRDRQAGERGHDEAQRANDDRDDSVDQSREDAVLLTTLDGRILCANPAASAIFGHTAEEFVDVGVTALVTTGDEALRTLLDACKRAGGSKGQVRFMRKDGRTFDGEVSSSTFFYAAGQARMSLVVRDVARALTGKRGAVVDRAADGTPRRSLS